MSPWPVLREGSGLGSGALSLWAGAGDALYVVVASMVNRNSCSPALWCQCRYTRTSCSNRRGSAIPARGDELAIVLRSRVSKTTTRVLNGSRDETSSCAARRVPSSDQRRDLASMLSGREIARPSRTSRPYCGAAHLDLLRIPDVGAKSPWQQGSKPAGAHDILMPGRGTFPNTGDSATGV